jgi:co-chaperonin GroES (HSP10)
MQEKFNEDLIKRINSLSVPSDLKNITFDAIPLGKSVIIQETINGERKSKGGIIISTSKLSQGTVGYIIAVGPEVVPYLRVGLKVMYNVHANLELVIAGDPYLTMHETDIYAILADDVQVNMAAEPEKFIKRRAKQEEQKQIFKRVAKKNQEDNDKYEETVKKSIKKTLRLK